MSDDHDSTPCGGPSLRGCLTRLLGQTATRPDLTHFCGQLWLTYPAGRRLAASPLSGDLDPGTIRGQTFPDILAMLATILTTEHGHVLCHSLIPPGVTGVAAIGYTVWVDPDGFHLVRPRPMLVGVMVQLDGRELILQHDPATGVSHIPHDLTTLDTVLANTWAIAEAIDNMRRAPLGGNAARLAQEIVDVEPRLVLASGHSVKMSGSDIPGSASHKQATAFVRRAAEQAAEERPAPPPRTPTVSIIEDAVTVAKVFTKPKVDHTQVVARRFRHVD